MLWRDSRPCILKLNHNTAILLPAGDSETALSIFHGLNGVEPDIDHHLTQGLHIQAMGPVQTEIKTQLHLFPAETQQVKTLPDHLIHIHLLQLQGLLAAKVK